jgi:hypothetical protein
VNVQCRSQLRIVSNRHRVHARLHLNCHVTPAVCLLQFGPIAERSDCLPVRAELHCDSHQRSRPEATKSVCIHERTMLSVDLRVSYAVCGVSIERRARLSSTMSAQMLLASVHCSTKSIHSNCCCRFPTCTTTSIALRFVYLHLCRIDTIMYDKNFCSGLLAEAQHDLVAQ